GTVIAVTVLSGDPKEYAACPFCISGTCKREDGTTRSKLLSTSVEAVTATSGPARILYYIASDGAANQRTAVCKITLTKKLTEEHELYQTLGILSLFDIHCGDNFITCDFDWKHILKRFRNTLLRMKGLSIHGMVITVEVIKFHLVMGSRMKEETATLLLNALDRQNVCLMVRLLNALAALPELPNSAAPTVRTTRRILHLLGQLYRHLLDAYLDVKASLSQQLTSLSAAAHIVLALYNENKGGFIPVQLCFDFMSMVKNAYFCVAKVQLHNPGGKFWVILLGTDSLEKVFGMVCSMIGNNCNVDQLQLTQRIDGATHCVNILAEHPEWGGESRRLHVKSISEAEDSEVSSKYDHLNPRSWVGDVEVRKMVLLTCWEEGCEQAEMELNDAGVNIPFEMMRETGGFNTLCPLSSGKMILIDDLSLGEENEEEDEAYGYNGPDPDSAPTDTSPIPFPSEPPQLSELDDSELDPGMEAEMADKESTENGTKSAKHEAWVLINEGVDKHAHKETVLRLYSTPFHYSDSSDRLF
ncbi:hypothetical protein AAF712_016769, partial [Marasmius tenuissimus]